MDQTTSPANNSPLSEEELNYFKEKLLEEQEESRKKMDQLKERLDDLTHNEPDTQSVQDHHQGDIASKESDKTVLMSGIEREKEKLEQITVALDRIESGNYGLCIDTGQPIQKGRLEAMPYAIRSVGAKS